MIIERSNKIYRVDARRRRRLVSPATRRSVGDVLKSESDPMARPTGEARPSSSWLEHISPDYTYYVRMPTLHIRAGRPCDQKKQRETNERTNGRTNERTNERPTGQMEKKERKSGYTLAADVACLRGLRTLVEGALDATIREEVLRLVSA